MCCLAFLGSRFAGFGVWTWGLVMVYSSERSPSNRLARGVLANLQSAVGENVAERIQWAQDRGRSGAAETFVREFGEDAVRHIRARLSALGEAEEA
jgi:hypothetical protein